MNRTTFPTLALLTVLCCGSAIRGQAQTTLPPPPKKDPQSAGAVTLDLGPDGIRVAITEDQAEQLRGKITKGSVGVVCQDVQMTQAFKNGKPVLRIVCHRAVFCTHHGLEGRADVLQYDSDAAIRLIGAELIVDRYRDDPPDRISAKEIIIDLNDLVARLSGVCIEVPKATLSAKEIIIDLNDLGVKLNGVCTEGPKAKEAAHTECEPRKRATARQTRLSAVRRLSFLKARPGKDPEMNELIFLRLGPAGVRVATNEKHVWQLLEADVPKDTLLVGCFDVCFSKVPSKNETTFRVVCQQAAFVRNDGLAGQADVLQYDSDAAIQLTGARLLVNLYRDAPPGRILAKEITLEFDSPRITLSGVRTAAARVAKETPQAGHEPPQTTGAR